MRPESPHGRSSVGATIAAVPHILILAMMAAYIVAEEGVHRADAGYLGFVELSVVPIALLAAAGVRFFPRLRAWSVGIVWSTLSGAAVVLLATLVVGNGGTWT